MTTLLELLRTSPAFFTALCAVAGLMVGSFLNVVIHRLPKMLEREWHTQCAQIRGENPPAGPRYNLVTPRSACPACGHLITARENVPLLSFLFLRGRCAHCGARISLRYPLVEGLTALVSAFIAWRFGFGAAALAALPFAWALIALTFIDLDTQLLPDAITQPLLWVGLLVNLTGVFTDLPSAVIGAVAGYLVLWGVYWLFRLVAKKEGMGYGDFKLLSAVGAWLGWQTLPLVILLSSLAGAVVGISLIVFARRGRNVPLPFGPYLAGGALFALFWGQDIIRLYLQGL
jgi:leader peptidase (prepilin peptidase)/N-methyltransferase